MYRSTHPSYNFLPSKSAMGITHIYTHPYTLVAKGNLMKKRKIKKII